MSKLVFKTRHKARALALQALYEVDTVGHPAEQVLSRLLEEAGFPEDKAEFTRELVQGVIGHMAEIDSNIKQFAPAWPVSQIPVIDRNILRLAIFEILLDNKIPVRIVINEAVELAKSFGSDSTPKFINGVLGSVVSHLKDNQAVET
jgi:transcription antitermination protein NusB